MEVTKVTYPNFKKTPPFIEKKDIIDERGFVNNKGCVENANIRSVGIRPLCK